MNVTKLFLYITDNKNDVFIQLSNLKNIKFTILYILMFNLINKVYNRAMEMNDLFNLLHNAVEAQSNGKKISQKEMAQRLGISMRSYQDWRLGNAKPQAAKAVLDMLGMLEDDEIIRVVRKINKLGKVS